MRRANHLSELVIVSIGTFAAALGGCKEAGPESDSRGRAAFGNSPVEYKGLPEVVVTAQRPQSKTMTLSTQGAGAASR